MTETKRKLKETPWYSGVNPLRSRPGLYQCICCMDYLMWDGVKWYWQNPRNWVFEPCQGPVVWRGLAR